MTIEKLKEIVKKLAEENNKLEARVEALEGNCACVVDPEDGSTIEPCDLHPKGGSLKGTFVSLVHRIEQLERRESE
jgi:BMFP domain-containing protein YqiC